MDGSLGFATDALAGKVALVTGAGGGIGAASAVALAAAGADVAIVEIDGARGEGTAARVRACARRSFAIEADLANLASLPGVLQRATAALGPIDILVNNAAVSSPCGTMDCDDDTWQRLMAINLTAPWKLLQLVARQMLDRDAGGRIINLSSSSAYRALMTTGPYGIAKAGISQLTRGAAAELGPHGINVNTIAPGLTATPMTTAALDTAEIFDQSVRAGPLANLLHRVGQPDDVAALVVFLALPSSRQITGQVIHTSAGAIV